MISFGESSQEFTQKFVTMLILKAFSTQKQEHLSIRQNSLNYLAGLIAAQAGPVLIKGEFLVKIINLQFRYFMKKEYFDAKVFDLCFLQSLALQFSHRAEDIERESPELFATIIKTLFVEGRKSLPFVYGTVLRSLADLCRSRQSLSGFVFVIEQAQKLQEEKVLSHHKLVFDRISKNFPFQAMYYIYPDIEYPQLPKPIKR